VISTLPAAPVTGAGRPTVRSPQTRLVVVVAASAILLVLGILVSASVGESPIPIGEVVRTLLGLGSPSSELILLTLRLPRVLAAVLVGAGLGLSGALLQAVARNPLASPDILGIQSGAAVAAVTVVILAGSAGGVSGLAAALGLPLAALVGAFSAGLVLWLLALHGRRLDPMRLVIVGVGLNAAGGSVVSWLLTLGDVTQVGPAIAWLTGSLHAATWPRAVGVLLALLLCLPVLVVTARRLDALALGDDAAAGLGVAVDRTRMLMLVVAIVLAAAATSVAGVVAFLALAAPQLAQRAAGLDRPPLAAGGLVAAALLVWADLFARQGLSWLGMGAVELPVGVLTAVLGAPYLLWVVARDRAASPQA
jgi:iron complex transport system permease protein